MHPCITQTFVLNHSPIYPLWKTALIALLYRILIEHTRSCLILYFFIVAYSDACHSRSNSFLTPVKTWYRSWWCAYFSYSTLRLNICIPVLLPALNTACSSAIIACACGLTLFIMTFSITLFGSTDFLSLVE